MFPAQPRVTGPVRFRFAVVADTHVNEHDGESGSPYRTNALANARARQVFAEIAALDPAPAFVVHLGDIVHPVPAMPTYGEAAARFREIAAPLAMPLHLVPGNHDVGDKRIDWMPADPVNATYLARYRSEFGDDHHAFDHGGIRMLVVNSLLINSGLPEEARQRAWLERELDGRHPRAMVFMHYPPYLVDPTERGSYDNLDEPGRGWLLGLLRRPGVEAVFAGHVHNFWYDRIGDAAFYMLPSTAFLRHDFTEFYRVAPAVEFGRGDATKFGWFVVDVHDDGHVAYPVRSHGRALAADAPAPTRFTPVLASPKTAASARVGLELRHPWNERLQIAATGGVQEFGRKWARNDYPLLGLWEMGARLLKVPVDDLLDPVTRERMALLADVGHRFVVTTIGAPGAAVAEAAAETPGIDAIEFNATLAALPGERRRLADFRERCSARLVYAPIQSRAGDHGDGRHFSHVIRTGLEPAHLDAARSALAPLLAEGLIHGVTARLDAADDFLATAAFWRDQAAALGCPVLVSLKLGAADIAQARTDDVANAIRTAQALVIAAAEPDLAFVFDSLVDVDRGYCPRNAFLDRRYDPRPAARVFAWMNAWLSGFRSVRLLPVQRGDSGTDIALAFEAEGRRHTLLGGAADAVQAARARSGVAADAWTDVIADAATDGVAAAAATDGAGRLLLLRH